MLKHVVMNYMHHYSYPQKQHKQMLNEHVLSTNDYLMIHTSLHQLMLFDFVLMYLFLNGMLLYLIIIIVVHVRICLLRVRLHDNILMLESILRRCNVLYLFLLILSMMILDRFDYYYFYHCSRYYRCYYCCCCCCRLRCSMMPMLSVWCLKLKNLLLTWMLGVEC